MAGYDVALAAELRHPEAVDHVGRPELQPHGAADGQVDLVGSEDGEVRIAHLPPPLVSGDVDVERPGGSNGGRGAEGGADRGDCNRDQHERRPYGPRYLELYAFTAHRGRLALAQCPRGVAEQREDQEKPDEDENEAVPADHLEVQRVGPLGEVGLRREGGHGRLGRAASAEHGCQGDDDSPAHDSTSAARTGMSRKPGSAASPKAPKKPAVIRNSTHPNGIAAGESDGATRTYRSIHIPASPSAQAVPRTAGVRFACRPMSVTKGTTQTSTSAIHPRMPQGSRWTRGTTKKVSSGIAAYQMGRYCDHRR